MTLPLSKEHIAAIQARAEESIKAIGPDIPALCQQALRAIELEAEVERLQKLVFVPGMWKCAKCSFVTMHMVLRASDGAVGVKADSKTEICPNGCGPLWPVTERDAGNDLADRLEKVTLERNSTESDLTTARNALEQERVNTAAFLAANKEECGIEGDFDLMKATAVLRALPSSQVKP